MIKTPVQKIYILTSLGHCTCVILRPRGHRDSLYAKAVDNLLGVCGLTVSLVFQGEMRKKPEALAKIKPYRRVFPGGNFIFEFHFHRFIWFQSFFNVYILW